MQPQPHAVLAIERDVEFEDIDSWCAEESERAAVGVLGDQVADLVRR